MSYLSDSDVIRRSIRSVARQMGTDRLEIIASRLDEILTTSDPSVVPGDEIRLEVIKEEIAKRKASAHIGTKATS